MLQVVSYNKCCSYCNNNFVSTLELKKYLQEVDSISSVINYDFTDAIANNYYHRVVVKMEQHHTNYSWFTIMEDNKPQVKVTGYRIVAITNNLNNYYCYITNILLEFHHVAIYAVVSDDGWYCCCSSCFVHDHCFHMFLLVHGNCCWDLVSVTTITIVGAVS